MTERMSREAAVAWVKAHPSETWNAAAAATRRSGSTLRRWCKAEGYEKPPAPNPVAAAVAKRARQRSAPRGTPAADLPIDDREQLVATIRKARTLYATVVDRLAAKVDELDETESVEIDRGAASLLKQLSSSMRDLVETHPGLMAEVDKAEGGSGVDHEGAERLATMYGVPLEEVYGGSVENA